ncbi:hypothetical protein PCANC_20021 [Puccinia coronata f. sp. avenae]|uniref:Uncharacterized protein n=1 Tax=Puccinia coronata f. sp. avenae TaxID=200324 RepID=A0A2N5S9C6_9BASI|nr:hypothetical protein PCANC_20021 [Puccinia coronata f. sp. avenae]
MSRVVKGNSRLIFRPKNNTTANTTNTPQPTTTNNNNNTTAITTTNQPTTNNTNESSTHHTTQLSPAQKMKLKAQAAKAARAALKTSSRATSIATEMEPAKHSLISSTRKPTPDPTIDPILDSLTSSRPTTHDHPFQHDIPVPDNTLSNTANPSPTSTLTQSPQSVTATHQPLHIPTSTTTNTTSSHQVKSIPKKKPTKKTNPEEAPDEEEEEEDISPRLKRKRHLEQLRKNKKNKSNNNQGESQVCQTNDRVHQKSITKLKAQARKPKSSTRTKKGSKGKKAVVGDENGGTVVVEGRSGPDGGEGEEEEEEEEGPLDPTKVSMASLTNAHLSKGQTSEVLEKRVEMIMERRDREKKERMTAREEKKRQAKLVLINRAQSVKARRKQQRLDDQHQQQLPSGVQKEPDEEQLAVTSDEEMADGFGDNDNDDNDDDGEQEQDKEKEAESRKQKIMQEYGLEDIDSDDDLADFEEVEYDEFARKQKTTTTTAAASSSFTAAAAPAATSAKSKKKAAVPHDEQEEEEEVEVEEFNVDDYVPQASQYAPQLRVVDGQMVLDQDSLEVNRRDQSPSQLDDMEVVEESDTTRLVNSNTWSKAVRGERWTADETGLFYDAVRLFGSDFEMISQLFPGRTRRQIRLKWNKEEKISPDEITRALLGKKPAPAAVAAADGELERISEASDERSDHTANDDDDDDDDAHEEREDWEDSEGGTRTEADSGVDVERLVMPRQLRTFREYARIVGIDATGPIPEDPMDKWREKERLELEKLDRAGQPNKSAPDLTDMDPDAQEDEVQDLVHLDFAGWGELDDD